MRETREWRIVGPESENVRRRAERQNANITFTIILALVVVAALGMSSALQSDTLTEWWKPASACMAAALIAGYPLRKGIRLLIGDRMKWLRYPIAVVITFSMLLFAFYSLNYYLSDNSTRYEYTGKIINKYSAERYRTRRTPGGRSVRGEKYTAYFIVIEMPEGKRKRLSVNTGNYVQLKRGKKVRMDIETGLFGIPVIRKTDLGL